MIRSVCVLYFSFLMTSAIISRNRVQFAQVLGIVRFKFDTRSLAARVRFFSSLIITLHTT